MGSCFAVVGGEVVRAAISGLFVGGFVAAASSSSSPDVGGYVVQSSSSSSADVGYDVG